MAVARRIFFFTLVFFTFVATFIERIAFMTMAADNLEEDQWQGAEGKL